MEIDLSVARETVRQLAERLEALDGRAVDQAPTREGSRQRTEISRTLQHLAHLGDKASVEIMEVFYDFRGWDRPSGK
ncbi:MULTISPECIES: hypothetical protein [Streptomyces]|uniref:Uncharacterized protein n=3 Tax=Streptomyces TaxID=1883 RepID=A0A0A0NN16_STRRN|nr:hypothetical protein [Streptomyces rapamycinicus]AGP58349.1 hypothetical protein M271_34690 [Streptomyces rapamycinicus NRRL 5491]MBB4786043.1 hypothetical protein [Streptomyces rapamycinicus]RLV78494.1 hypothetical protein D3C57_108955 [Streptomyces rapamycinicus NRRL 5491]UTO66165.1 hypothetical protein LJB45_30150 [Streptomyces rapamycinicus]UTP34119.1 hypothetical protein LIV37_35285 [Streptomyces rapamycinicus NRRL 5491]